MDDSLKHEKRGLGTVHAFILRNFKSTGKEWQPVIWVLALLVGIVTAYAVIGFRLLIAGVQWSAFGVATEHLYTTAQTLAWWQIMLAPTLGGVVVGLLLYLGGRWGAIPDEHAHGVADVMEARGLHAGKIQLSTGLISALISGVSLGAGASTGREGPAVHLGASISSLLASRMGYTPIIARTFLACGAAAAVSASFNTPLAGVLFALEVVLGHYALSVFAPVVIASVAATIITRIELGEFPTFILPAHDFGSYAQLPSFVLLGIVSGVVAIIFMKSSIFLEFLARDATEKFSLPLWIKPAIAGLLVGVLALVFPQILGVGYEATEAAHKGLFSLWLLVALIGVKILATSISLAGRFGGGVFSPALYLGTMTGAAFGIVAGALFPDLVASKGFYAIVGMGAVSAAILGAPISTTLIAFELVREYQVTIAVMVSVSIATLLTQAVLGRSFFHWQIEQHGYHLSEGPQDALLHIITVRDVMTRDFSGFDREELDEEPHPTLKESDDLKTVFALMESENVDTLAVVDEEKEDVIGLVRRNACLSFFNQALIQAHVESHH